LDDIWSYIAQDNVQAADKVIKAIVSKFSKLTTMPLLGRRRSELTVELRSFPVSRYVIFYIPIKDGIQIVRVLHGARDLPPLFE